MFIGVHTIQFPAYRQDMQRAWDSQDAYHGFDSQLDDRILQVQYTFCSPFFRQPGQSGMLMDPDIWPIHLMEGQVEVYKRDTITF